MTATYDLPEDLFDGRRVWNAADHGGPDLYLGMDLGERIVALDGDTPARVPLGKVIAFCNYRDEIPADPRSGDDGRAFWSFAALTPAALREDDGNYVVGLIDRDGEVRGLTFHRNLVAAVDDYADNYGGAI